MKTVSPVVGTVLFFVLAPGTVAGLVPWWITGWQVVQSGPALAIGALVVAGGIVLLVSAFARFATFGGGTPAPIYPTRRLVVVGPYRYVRNPMYIAVVAIVLGQAVLMGDARLAIYGAVLGLAFHAFILGYEEPTLRRVYDDEFAAYCALVPRWIPRLTPWR